MDQQLAVSAITIEPSQPDAAMAIARLHDYCWRATYGGMMPPEIIARSTLARREARWNRLLGLPEDERCAFVARNGREEIVGCAWGGPEESDEPFYRGEVLGIYLLPAYQRHGTGSRLLGAVAAALLRRGYPSILLWALAENRPARRFYEARGGQLLRERATAMEGGTINEVAYGWPDARRLTGG
jgi:ribosomal protein S18 acetylase RimI-like enzyme